MAVRNLRLRPARHTPAAKIRPARSHRTARADVAQLVERRLPKPKVAGSRPVVRLRRSAPRLSPRRPPRAAPRWGGRRAITDRPGAPSLRGLRSCLNTSAGRAWGSGGEPWRVDITPARRWSLGALELAG